MAKTISDRAKATLSKRASQDIEATVRRKFRNERDTLRGKILNIRGEELQDMGAAIAFLHEVQHHDNEAITNEAPLYCSRTGQRTGTLSLDLVNLYRQTIDGTESGEKFLSDITLCATPAPHWQSLSAERLRANEKLDPIGYFCYMTDFLLFNKSRRYKDRLKTGGYQWKSEPERLAWQRSKVMLNKALRANCAIEHIIAINSVMTAISGEIGLGFIELAFEFPHELGRNDYVLRLINNILESYWKEYQLNPGHFKQAFRINPAPVHRKAAVYAVEDESIDVQAEFLDLIMSAAFMDNFEDFAHSETVMNAEPSKAMYRAIAKRKEQRAATVRRPDDAPAKKLTFAQRIARDKERLNKNAAKLDENAEFKSALRREELNVEEN